MKEIDRLSDGDVEDAFFSGVEKSLDRECKCGHLRREHVDVGMKNLGYAWGRCIECVCEKFEMKTR